MLVGKLEVITGAPKDKPYILKSLSVFEVGRSPGNHIQLKDSSVAMSHFRICQSEGVWTIYDLGSRQGTKVNGERLEKAVLKDGDVIEAGVVELRFDLVDADEACVATGRPASCGPDLDDTKAIAARGPSAAEPAAAASTAVATEPKEVVSHGTYAYLRVIDGEEKGKSYRLIGKKEFSIGRSTKSDIRLKDGKVSRIHCIVERAGDHYIVVDQESANGTHVNGEQVRKTVLKEGDYLRLGYSILRFGWTDGLGNTK